MGDESALRDVCDWKAQHRDEDVSLRQLADMSKSRVIVAVAEERATNWMAVDSAAKVSAMNSGATMRVPAACSCRREWKSSSPP